MSTARMLQAFVLAAALLLASAPGRADEARRMTPATQGRYVDVYEYLTSDAQFEAWYTLTSQLRQGFDQVCGDTFCEGDFSNIQSLRYRCSVDRGNGRIGQCLWVLAGSYEDVDPLTGRVIVTAKVWRCRSPLAPLTSIEELLASLAGPGPLRAQLPRSTRSIYDGLVDCL